MQFLGIRADLERHFFLQICWRKSESGGYRIAYVLVERSSMVWLHAFKKRSQKTKQDDLELAMKRMKEVLS